MVLLLAVAFVAGIVTVLSPCILPVLPIVLGTSLNGGKLRPLGIIAGLVISFSIFTLVISQLVALLGLSANVLRIIAIIVIALLGLTLLVPALNDRMELLVSRFSGSVGNKQRAGFWGGILTGATLGIVWAPCAGPILAAVTTLAATQQVTAAATLVVIAYALGAGVPLLGIAYGSRALVKRTTKLARYGKPIQQGFGALMLIVAGLMLFNLDVQFTVWATAALPASYTATLQTLETSPQVRSELNQLNGNTSAAFAALETTGDTANTNPVQPAVNSANPVPALPTDAPTSAAMVEPTNAPASPTEAMNSNPTAAPADSGASGAKPPVAAPSPTTVPPTQVASNVSAQVPEVNLPIGPAAPELTGITKWVNSDPQTIAGLKGKVVLVDFWTYSCINCIRTLPYVTQWYDKYKDDGFVVLGIHSPEFAFEHDTANVADAINRFNIHYPVGQDNDFKTWTAYQNQYWPADYLIDAQGRLRSIHFGEGNYAETEQAIRQLLAEAGKPVRASFVQETAAGQGPQSPETYVGAGRQEGFASPESVQLGNAATYSLPSALPLNHFAVSGSWQFDSEYAQPLTAGDKLQYHFVGKDVYLVMSSDTPARVRVNLLTPGLMNHSPDADDAGDITVQQSRLYHLVSLDKNGEGTLELQFDQPGVKVYAFTFGS